MPDESTLNWGEIKNLISTIAVEEGYEISTVDCTQGDCGDPINTRTGVFSFASPDISLPTSAGNLVFQRAYSSGAIAAYADVLGFGWTHNQDARLMFPTDPGGKDGYVLFKDVFGNQYPFALQEDGSFLPGAGVLASLAPSTSSPITYTLTTPEQAKLVFNESGRLISRADAQGRAFVYAYNPQGRLTRISADQNSRYLDLAYDEQGRIISVTDHSGRQVTYAYDLAGDLISTTDLLGRTWQYVYDFDHRMTQVVDPSGKETVTTEYGADGRATRQWDGNGDLMVRIVYRCNGLSSGAWGVTGCESDRVSQTVNGVTTNYVLDQATGLTQVLLDGTNTYLYGNGRIGQLTASDSAYFLTDALGSVRQLTDGAGVITETKSYEPYGEVLSSAGSGASIYGFDGEQFDPATGLIYLRARYYSGAMGRFLTRDSWLGNDRAPMSYNVWLFGYSNPIRFTDPDGKTPYEPPDPNECVSSKQVVGLDPRFASDVCAMIRVLEKEHFLKDVPDQDHIGSGIRSNQVAHRWSTAYSIIHDKISITDLRKTPRDLDGNVWYNKNWEFIPRDSECHLTPVLEDLLEYRVKKNASDKADNFLYKGRNPFKGWIKAGLGYVKDVPFALEGYPGNDPKRLPNFLSSQNLPMTKHVLGLAVDIEIWGPVNLWDNRIKDIADKYNLVRPFTENNGKGYPEEAWHFERP